MENERYCPDIRGEIGKLIQSLLAEKNCLKSCSLFIAGERNGKTEDPELSQFREWIERLLFELRALDRLLEAAEIRSEKESKIVYYFYSDLSELYFQQYSSFSRVFSSVGERLARLIGLMEYLMALCSSSKAEGNKSHISFAQIKRRYEEFNAIALSKFFPKEKVSSVSDDVQFRLASQDKLSHGEWVLVKFMMYEKDDFERADREASRISNDVNQNTSGLYEMERETVLRVRLQSDDVQIDDSERTLIWKGRYSSCDFGIFLPQESENLSSGMKKQQVRLKARIYEGSAPLADLSLILSIYGGLSETAERCRFKSAFLSYSSKDRAQVLSYVRGMKLVRDDMDLFMDVLELRRGERYEPRLLQEICTRDLFYLFWSRSAAESQWVEKELKYALENKSADSIEPIPLEPPEICPPPASLKDRHFNDWLMLYQWSIQNMENN